MEDKLTRLTTYLNDKTEKFSVKWFIQNTIVFGILVGAVMIVTLVDNAIDYLG